VSGEDNAIWSPTSSTPISGEHDAVLVDALPSVQEAGSLADWITSKGKTLTTVSITHGHGDHHFGLGVILKRFPRARALASPDGLDTDWRC
jgi:glyoxylase-like metal-dependent hydrolase (beta-lactamase superfamily II)